jgi:hypothetical protein
MTHDPFRWLNLIFLVALIAYLVYARYGGRRP